MAGLLDLIQSASNAVAGNVSGPVDMLAWGLRKAGLPIPSDPVGGAEWMRRHGLMRDVAPSASSVAGETLGLLAPVAIPAKAAQIARGLLAAEEAAPQMMSAGRTVAPNQQGIFAGLLAKTADKDALLKAQKMTAAGADPREVWAKTGWFKAPEGKWKFEIPDNQAMTTLGGDMSLSGPVDAAITHSKLFESYPQLRQVDGSFTSSPEAKIRGSYQSTTVDGKAVPGYIIGSAKNADGLTSVQLHELQHGVQDLEGFARGGTPDMAFRDSRTWGKKESKGSDVAFKMLEKKLSEMATPIPITEYAKSAWGADAVTPEIAAAYKEYASTFGNPSPALVKAAQQTVARDWYRQLAGEAEARAVQARRAMTPEQRRATFPLDSYDVPVDQLIIR